MIYPMQCCSVSVPYQSGHRRLCDFVGFSPTTLPGQLSTLAYEAVYWPRTLVFPVSFSYASGVPAQETVLCGLRYEWSDLQTILGTPYNAAAARQTLRLNGQIDSATAAGRFADYQPATISVDQTLGYVSVLRGAEPEERNRLAGRPIRFRIGYAQALKNGSAIGPVTTVSSTSAPTLWTDTNFDGLATQFIRAAADVGIRFYGGSAFANVNPGITVEAGDKLGIDIWLVCDHGPGSTGFQEHYVFSTQLGSVYQPVPSTYRGVLNWYGGSVITAESLTLQHTDADWTLSWAAFPESDYWPDGQSWQETLPDRLAFEIDSENLPNWCELEQAEGVHAYTIGDPASWKLVLDTSTEMPTIRVLRISGVTNTVEAVYQPEQDEVYSQMALGSSDGPHEQGGWESDSDILFKLDTPPTVAPAFKYAFPTAIQLTRPV